MTTAEDTLISDNKSRIQEIDDEDVDDVSSVSSVSDNEDHHDHHHEDHDHDHDHGHQHKAAPRPINRLEKKARKHLAKLGLKPAPEVKRVTVRRGKQIFYVDAPDVFKYGTEYVVFGDLRQQTGDLAALLQQHLQQPSGNDKDDGAQGEMDAKTAQEMLEKLERENPDAARQARVMLGEGGIPPLTHSPRDDEKEGVQADNEEQDGDLPEGVDAKDVRIVMSQAGVSRSKAIAELVKQNGDIVNAIMELTM